MSSDVIDTFLTLNEILKSIESGGKGYKLGYVPICVSSTEEIRECFDDQQQSKEGFNETSALIKLQEVLNTEVPRNFCCGGRINILDLIKEKDIGSLGIELNDDVCKKEYHFDNIMAIDVEKLKRKATTSTYGDISSQKTVVNEEVRKALEMKLSSVHFYTLTQEANEFADFLSCTAFENAIQKMLTNQKVSILCHKLNIYEEGGMFKPHVDTPRAGCKMLGTLVICLPCEHSGGDLVVSHGGHTHTFDSGAFSWNYLQWFAFFGDCIHEVKPVKSGTRLTITFDILAEKVVDLGSKYQLPEHWTIGESPMDRNVMKKYHQQRILSALKALRPYHKKVGIILQHRYPLDTDSDLMLKGADDLLYRNITEYYSRCKICTVLHVESIGYYDNGNLSEARRSFIYRFMRSDYMAFLNNTEIPPSDLHSIPFIPVNSECILSRKYQQSADFSANEALPTKINVVYYDTVLIINLEKSQKRQKI